MTTITDRLAGARSSLGYKAPCKVATDANITLSGLQTIDGVAVVARDRVLVRAQTDGTENGIYEVSATAWVRAADFSSSRDITQGTRVNVVSGTSNQGEYELTTSGDIVIGTTSLSFAGYTSSVGSGATFTSPVINGDLSGTAILDEDDFASDSATKVPTQQSAKAYIQSTWEGAGIFRAEDYGLATGNTAAANTTALEAAITAAVAAGGGIIQIAAGSYPMNGPITITDNHIRIRGAGQWATVIDVRTTSGHMFVFDTVQYSGVEDLAISARNIITTSGQTAIVYQDSCFQTFAHRIRIEYFSNGIFLEDVSSHEMEYILLRYLTYNRGLIVQGSVSVGTYGWRMENFDADNPYPHGDPAGNVTTWATSTAYSVGDTIRVNGAIWQCSSAGTSAGSGSGPSTRPGTNNVDLFSTEVTDGTAAWKFVCDDDLVWALVENYAYSGSIDNAALLNGWQGLRIQDTANTGTSRPKWFNSYGLEIDHTYDHAIALEGGEGFYGTGGWWGSSLQGRGVVISSNWDGETYVGDGTRIVGNWLDGILVQPGPVATNISNSHIFLNSQSSAGTYHGITVGAAATRISINNNIIGRGVSGSGQQGYGIFISTGVDYIAAVNNITEGNATGGVSDLSTEANKTVSGNI